MARYDRSLGPWMKHLQRMMLVFMDLATGYLLMEEVATDRSFGTGTTVPTTA